MVFNPGVATPMWIVRLFLEVARASSKSRVFIITSVSYMETLFAVAKIIGSHDKNCSLLFHSNLFQCDFDYYKVLSVVVTITVHLHSARQEKLCDVRLCFVCKFGIWLRHLTWKSL